MTLNKTIEMRINKYLKEKGLTRNWLEENSGLSHTVLTHIYSSEKRGFNFSTIAKICQALNISLREFFDDDIFNLNNVL